MAFKEVIQVEAETTTALGGRNKQTGKANPTRAEGYFLGVKRVESKKARSGFSNIYVLQTSSGNLGIWGKTDLDRKMSGVTPGNMIRITQNGMLSTPNGDMYKYKVEVDAENTIDVSSLTSVSADVAPDEYASNSASNDAEYASNSASNDAEYASNGDDEVENADDLPSDEVVYAKAMAPKVAATTPSAASVAKVKALLNGNRPKTA